MKQKQQKKDIFAIVDVETTGASPTHDRVIEIGIIRIEQGNVVEKFTTVIDPETYVPPSIFSLTGIGEAEISRAPTFVTVAEKVRELLKDAIFVAHNARFDYAFIKQELDRAGIKFAAKCLCTVKLSRRLFPEYKKHDLSTIITRFDFVCEARHRAMADAEVLVDFLKVCEKKFGQEVVHDAYKIVMKRNALPVALSHEHIDALPETAGVYIFYGDEGDTLYIGKSINIRNRVLSHFSDDHRSGKEMRMSQEIADIEAIPTSGELGALLLESHLIKERQPLYNRMSRYSRELVAAIESQNEAGYSSVSLERIADAQKLETEKVLGIFRSLKQAKTALNDLAKEHHLCPALLGIESNKRSCFFSQLGICKGACSGKEKADVYNARFTKGFARKRVKVWPFAGPVLITEKKDEYQGTVFVVDDWRLVESYVYDETGKQKFLPPTYVFDHDAYKILAGYLKKNKNIKPVTKSEFSRLGDYEGVTQSIDF